jgi:hypothetical protein
MATTPEKNSGEKQSTEFKLFAAKRIFLGAVGIVLLLWLASFALKFFDTPESEKTAPTSHLADIKSDAAGGSHATQGDASGHGTALEHGTETPADEQHAAEETGDEADSHATTALHGKTEAETATESHAAPAAGKKAASETTVHAGDTAPEPSVHGTPEHGVKSASNIMGVAFVEAMIAPMRYELEERFFGWRPNDIIEWTDNVNNYQLGVLEVTRRTAESLADRISRTGSTQAFEKELEKARSNFNINADQYWLPSAEASYSEAIELLENYKRKLMNGTAYFYNRTDNLIPLLRAYENLLGSCDDNLIKTHEDDGSEVSWFKADNYFFYAKGVASSMHTILEAVSVDFARTIETRRGTEVLHHALEALHHATDIDPILILDSDLDGILANHRSNMAGPISHARFYIGLLIETLST